MAIPMNDPTTDSPASKAKLFILVIVIIGALVAANFLMILRSRRTDPPPKSALPSPTTQLTPTQGQNALALGS
jgi:hypothetical protein